MVERGELGNCATAPRGKRGPNFYHLSHFQAGGGGLGGSLVGVLLRNYNQSRLVVSPFQPQAAAPSGSASVPSPRDGTPSSGTCSGYRAAAWRAAADSSCRPDRIFGALEVTRLTREADGKGGKKKKLDLIMRSPARHSHKTR